MRLRAFSRSPLQVCLQLAILVLALVSVWKGLHLAIPTPISEYYVLSGINAAIVVCTRLRVTYLKRQPPSPHVQGQLAWYNLGSILFGLLAVLGLCGTVTLTLLQH